jgi:short-subunit dehydrogenase
MVAKNAGGVINVASVAAFLQRAGSVSYGATKRWMVSFTEGLYLELKELDRRSRCRHFVLDLPSRNFHATLGVDRANVAPFSLWLQPEFVVDESLKSAAKGKLVVVPGWKYKAIVALVSKLPTPLRLAFEAAGSTKNSRWK